MFINCENYQYQTLTLKIIINYSLTFYFLIMNIIIRLLITAAVAFGLSRVLSGVHIPDFKEAFIFAIVLALLNIFIKPLLILLTLPITVLTLGIFLFVINAIIILLADKFMDGMRIDGFWWALIFSLILTLLSSALQSVLDKKR